MKTRRTLEEAPQDVILKDWEYFPDELIDLILKNTSALDIMALAADNPNTAVGELATKLDNQDAVWESFLQQDFPFEYARPELRLWAQHADALIRGYLENAPPFKAPVEKLYPGRPHKQMYIFVRQMYGVVLQNLRSMTLATRFVNGPEEAYFTSFFANLERDLETGRFPNSKHNRRELQRFMSTDTNRWNIPQEENAYRNFYQTQGPFATIVDFLATLWILRGGDSTWLGSFAEFTQSLLNDTIADAQGRVRFEMEQWYEVGQTARALARQQDVLSLRLFAKSWNDIRQQWQNIQVAQLRELRIQEYEEQLGILLPQDYQDMVEVYQNQDIDLLGIVEAIMDGLFIYLPIRQEETGALRFITARAKSGRRRGHKKWRSKYKGKYYWHGDNRYKAAPGTKRGDAYCARSWGIIKKHGKTPKNMLSRKKWKCRGKKSIKGMLNCENCGQPEPQFKCGVCLQVAYCNQECANAHAENHFE